ncbi:MAG: metallophosphoesterase [Clostridia bacterium]|nr:metallophosphoesterase [Clostridia bacterium]
MNKLKFNNGRFRILQLSDIQEIANTNPDTINLTREIIAVAQPDLIVLTGDQIKGYGVTMQKGDAKTNAALTLNNILAPIKESGVPFTAVFGNHDVFGDADADFQWNIYKLYDNFLGENYDFDCLPVYDEYDNMKFCVYCFDSGLKIKGKYFPVKDELVNNYKAKRDSLYNENGKYIPSLAFQHIPPADIYDCFDKVSKNTKGAYQGANSFKENYFALPSYAKNDRSFMGENAASPDEKGTQVEAFKEKGDVLGLFFGHDHNNSFVVKNGNLDLGYTQGLGFNIYGPGKNRGGRVFDIYENTPDKYETFTITANDLESFRLERPVKEFIYTHSPSSISEGVKLAKKVLTAAGIATATALAVKYIIK